MSFRSLLFLVLPLLSVTANAYTLVNATFSSNDSSITYYPTCQPESYPTCKGSWWKMYDDRFVDGIGMTTNGADEQFGLTEPYFAITFKGSAVYLYQWLNASAGEERPFTTDNSDDPQTEFTTEFASLLTGSNLTKVLAWSRTGMDPTKEHTVVIQHFTLPGADAPQSIYFDHFVITETIDDPSETTSHKVSVATIVGAVAGSLLGLSGLVLGFCFFRGWKRRRDARVAKAKGFDWQGSHHAPGPVKFGDPSSEIEQSEKMAREGRMEEEMEKYGKGLPPMV